MAGLKAKALTTSALEDEPPRESAQELTSRLRGAVQNLPSARPPDAPVVTSPEQQAVKQPLPTSMQINFRASPAMAKVLHELQRDAGNIGIRRLIARMLAEKGHEIPDEDLSPKFTRRSYDY